jgi:phosphatidylserine/phosphatidylglycerophosphate/cardiolipin synthase-like enzyme
MKALVADGQQVIIGSQNFTEAGNSQNDENTLLIKGPGGARIGKDFKAYFSALWQAIPEAFNCRNPGAESSSSGSTCHDGIDNDHDGRIDADDSGCN